MMSSFTAPTLRTMSGANLCDLIVSLSSPPEWRIDWVKAQAAVKMSTTACKAMSNNPSILDIVMLGMVVEGAPSGDDVPPYVGHNRVRITGVTRACSWTQGFATVVGKAHAMTQPTQVGLQRALPRVDVEETHFGDTSG